MSSPRKRVKNPQSSTPWFKRRPLVVLAGLAALVVVALAAISIISRMVSKANYVPEVSGAPEVAVAPQDAVDYGDVRLGTTIETVFQVSNRGDQTLIILGEPEVDVVEGC